ncbi:MAG: hypothetical protein F6J95_026145 [Leptolyngbya sp. SIO1E4]|nr:hypothetical protein [Leptolyngbya sp. SIO1E4]
MLNYTQGPTTRERIDATELQSLLATGTLLLDDRRRRPLYFDGRFLTARDLTRDQNYVLTRQADLSRTGSTGIVQGLMVTRAVDQGATVVRLSPGHGITPGGELVLVPEATSVDLADVAQIQRLNTRFGLSQIPQAPPRSRTGLFVLALRLVEFTANAIAAYPTRIDGDRSLNDGDIIEATAITLIPFPDSGTEAELDRRRSQIARQIFVEAAAPGMPSNVLPLAMVALERGSIVRWVDPFLVRREVGTETDTVLTLGMAPAVLREAHLMQYEQQLQDVLEQRGNQTFAATDYFDALPPAGPLPVGAINSADFTQTYFPPEMDVELSVIPVDELPLLLEESLLLPPIDLTVEAEALESTAVVVLIPAVRSQIAQLRNQLTSIARPLLASTIGLLARRKPLEVLQGLARDRANRLDRFTGSPIVLPTPTPESIEDAAWRNQLAQVANAGGLLWYVRRRNLTALASESGFSFAVGGGSEDDVADEAVTQLIAENPEAFEIVSNNLDLFNQLRLNPDVLGMLRDNADSIRPLIEDPEQLERLLANPEVLAMVQANPAAFNQVTQNPAVFEEIQGNLPIFREIANNPEVFQLIQARPDLFQSIAENPEVFEQILENPRVFERITEDPDIFERIRDNPNSFDQIRTNPQIFERIRANPDTFERIRVNPVVFDSIRDNPTVFDQIRTNPGAFDRVRTNPTVFDSIRDNPTLVDSLRENPDVFEQIQRDPTIFELVGSNRTPFNQVRENPEIFTAIATSPDTFNQIRDNAEVFTLIRNAPETFNTVRANTDTFTAVAASPDAFDAVRSNSEAFNLVSANADTFNLVQSNRDLFLRIGNNPDSFNRITEAPETFELIRRNEDTFNRVIENPNTFNRITEAPETFELIRRNEDTFNRIIENPNTFNRVIAAPGTFEVIRRNEDTFNRVIENPDTFNRVIENPNIFRDRP